MYSHGHALEVNLRKHVKPSLLSPFLHRALPAPTCPRLETFGLLIQSDPLGIWFGPCKEMKRGQKQDLTRRPQGCQTSTLTAELFHPLFFIYKFNLILGTGSKITEIFQQCPCV